MDNKPVNLKPFFTYYGGKWRSAPRYPQPLYDYIVEPFAGSAGYSLRHHTKKITLIDKDEKIISIWKFLQKSSPEDILKLPSIIENVDSLDLEDGAKFLIGFWLNKGAASPCKTPSAWMRSNIRPNSFWGEAIKNRISSQVDSIKHWDIIHGSYADFENIEATYFIDPPYETAGKLYRFGAQQIDYKNLGEWCKSRDGQIIVCEGPGATWLPFISHGNFKSTEGTRGKSSSEELIYCNDNLTV